MIGVDNDYCAGANTHPDALCHEATPDSDAFNGVRLPPRVDAGMAAVFLAFTDGDVREVFDAHLPETTSAAIARLRAIQSHIRTLQETGRVIATDGWGAETVTAALADWTQSYAGRDRYLANHRVPQGAAAAPA